MKKQLHVLPGDGIVADFKESKLAGETVICRECLIEGPTGGETLDEFWQTRAQFIAGTYNEDPAGYFRDVVGEFEKLVGLEPGTEVNLWFEHELFCQTNLWFCLYLLRDTKADVYRVMPPVEPAENVWQGFARLGPFILRQCFKRRVKFEKDDLRLGAELWLAYRSGDDETVRRLSETASPCFPYLQEVGQAQQEKSFRPGQILRDLMNSGLTDFRELFAEFSRRAGVYGFGDVQVRNILQRLAP